jgi:hypothetical protein
VFNSDSLSIIPDVGNLYLPFSLSQPDQMFLYFVDIFKEIAFAFIVLLVFKILLISDTIFIISFFLLA